MARAPRRMIPRGAKKLSDNPTLFRIILRACVTSYQRQLAAMVKYPGNAEGTLHFGLFCTLDYQRSFSVEFNGNQRPTQNAAITGLEELAGEVTLYNSESFGHGACWRCLRAEVLYQSATLQK